MRRTLLLLVFVLATAHQARAQTGFAVANFSLDPLSEGYNWAAAHDGSVVTGQGWGTHYWSRQAGFVAVPGTYSFRGVSGDGSTLVGTDGSDAVALWRSSGQVRGLRSSSDFATSASFDGSTIVTFSESTAWNPDTGQAVPLQPSPSSYLAAAVSPDGRWVVGEQGTFAGNAARWDALTGAGTPLGGYQGGNVWARGVSADGSVVVGYSPGPSLPALRWTQAAGWESLGRIAGLPDTARAGAFGVSADGERIVGYSQGHAFLWTAADGMQDLNTLLPALGVDIQGWTLSHALAISGDGMTIAGIGFRSPGGTRAWVATIPPPGAAPIFAAAGSALLLRRRR